jgi:hypothetical protein
MSMTQSDDVDGVVLDRVLFDSVWKYMQDQGFPIPQSGVVPDHVWFYVVNHYREWNSIWSGAVARMLIEAVLEEGMSGGYSS